MNTFFWMKHLALAVAGLAALLAPLIPRAAHGEPLSGPIPAHVVEVVDGDTVKVEARLWIDQYLKTDVRLAGIDTPENGGRAKCEEERSKAADAKAYLKSLIENRTVELRDIDHDKFGGRVDARVILADGRDVSALMIAQDLARPYDGGKRASWCIAGGSQGTAGEGA